MSQDSGKQYTQAQLRRFYRECVKRCEAQRRKVESLRARRVQLEALVREEDNRIVEKREQIRKLKDELVALEFREKQLTEKRDTLARQQSSINEIVATEEQCWDTMKPLAQVDLGVGAEGASSGPPLDPAEVGELAGGLLQAVAAGVPANELMQVDAPPAPPASGDAEGVAPPADGAVPPPVIAYGPVEMTDESEDSSSRRGRRR